MSLLDETDNQISIDPNLDYFEELTKPGAKFDKTKYQTEDDLKKEIAKAKWHGDQMIEMQKKQMELLRQDFLNERAQNVTKAKLDELINKIELKQLSSSATPPANEEQKPMFDPTQIDSLVSNKILEHETKRKEDINFNSVKEKLVERYGQDYRDHLSKAMSDIGYTSEEADQLARRNPKAFIKMFGLDQQPIQSNQFQPPIRSSILPQIGTGKDRTWMYYQEVRKKDSEAYYSPKVQQQLLEDYKRLGDKFEDGTFHQYN